MLHLLLVEHSHLLIPLQAQQRLTELESYREEYIKRFHSTGAVGMSAAQMMDYRAFMVKLDQAIAEQGVVVEQAAQRVEQQRQEWFSRRGKVKMLDTVVTRYQADERRDADRKEQGDQDERTQQHMVEAVQRRRWARPSSPSPPGSGARIPHLRRFRSR